MGFDNTQGAVLEAGGHPHIPALEEKECFLQNKCIHVLYVVPTACQKFIRSYVFPVSKMREINWKRNEKNYYFS